MNAPLSRSPGEDAENPVVSAAGPEPRPRIVRRLVEAASCPIILIVAPAGFGKTTAVHHMLAQHERAVFIATPHETSFERFIHAFADGCSSQFPEMASPPNEAIANGYDAENTLDLYIAWATAHLHNAKCIIAVDDLQHADHDRSIATFLTRLADISKGQVQWVFSSRTQSHLPITRWQVNGDADAPLMTDELRMTVSEVRDLAHSLNSPATSEMLDSWVEQTRGFPVPLAYAVRLSARRGTVSGIIDGTLSVTFDFLAEQLWASLSHLQRTLLEVAAFLPALHLHAYEDIGGRDGSAVISGLCEDIAFLALAADGTFSMHDLFRDFVRQQILLAGPDTQRARRNAAIGILVTVQRYNSAFELLLEESNMDNLANAVEELPGVINDLSVIRKIVDATAHTPPTKLGLEMLYLQTEYYSWFDLFNKARRFAEEIITRKDASSRHLLCAMLSIYRTVEFQSSEHQRDWLNRTHELLHRLSDVDRIVVLACQAALFAQCPDKRAEVPTLILKLEAQFCYLDPMTRIDAQLALATAFFHTGNADSALRATNEAAEIARSQSDIREIARTLNSYGLMLLYEYDSDVESLFHPLRDAVEKTGSWRYSQVSHWLPTAYYAWKGDLIAADAARQLQSSVISSDWQKRDLAYLRRHSTNLCNLIKEDYEAIISDFTTVALPTRSDVAYEILTDAAAAYALTSRLGQSERVLKQARQVRETLSALEVHAAREALLVEIVTLCAIGRWRQARRTNEQYRGQVSALAPLEQALEQVCNGPAFLGASAALQPCLARPFMGLVALLMIRVTQGSSYAPADLLLTAAEMEVLRLMGLGKSNKEIANARARSTETVKLQVASLCRKLGVENRTSAIAIGRERGLL